MKRVIYILSNYYEDGINYSDEIIDIYTFDFKSIFNDDHIYNLYEKGINLIEICIINLKFDSFYTIKDNEYNYLINDDFKTILRDKNQSIVYFIDENYIQKLDLKIRNNKIEKIMSRI